MNEPRAFCPKCKNDVAFVTVGNTRKCPECGFQFELTDPSRMISPTANSGMMSEMMSVVKVLLTVLLIMVGLAVVALGVLFAGCAFMAHGFH